MKSCLRKFTILLTIVAVYSCAPAQNPDEPTERPWLAEVPCEKNPERRIDVSPDVVACLKFDEKELQQAAAGDTRIADLEISTFMEKGRPNPQIEALPTVYESGRFPGLIIGLSSGPKKHETSRTSGIVNAYKITITDQVKPTIYELGFTTSLDPKARFPFKLPIAPIDGETALEVTSASQKVMGCWSGQSCEDVRVTLINRLPYEFEITKISFTSDPSDLLEYASKGPDTSKIKANSTHQTIGVKATPKSISVPRIFSGLGKFPQAFMTVEYKDRYEREFSKKITMGLEMKPNYIVLALTLLLGAVFGTIVRIDLGRLEKARLITRRQRIIFAATTFGSGVLVCLIALFANLKLSIFDAEGSYSAWDPKVLFLTALIGTIGGIPILYALLKLPVPKPDDDPPPK